MADSEITMGEIQAMAVKIEMYMSSTTHAFRLKQLAWKYAHMFYRTRYIYYAWALYRLYQQVMVRKIYSGMSAKNPVGYFARRLGYKTRRYGGRNPKAGKKLATVATVKRLINVNKENKCTFSTQNTLTTLLNNGNQLLYLLNGLTQGDTDNTRDGDIVTWSRLRMRFLIYGTGSSVYHVQVIRVKKPRGVAPTLTQMFGGTQPSPIDYPYYATQEFNQHYEIIYDKELPIHSNYSAQTMHTLCEVDISPDIKTDYSLGNAGTIADIDANALYLVVRTDNGANTTVNWSNLFFFKDN